MNNSTPPNASAKPEKSPPSIPSIKWLFETEETGSTSHLEAPGDASSQTEGLCPGYGGRSHAPSVASTLMLPLLFDGDSEGSGASPSEVGRPGSPGSSSSGLCGRDDDDASPQNTPCRHIRSVDATIRPVTPANAPVSVDTLSFSRRLELPRLRTSMVHGSSPLSHEVPGPSTETTSPPACVSPLVGDSEPRRAGEHRSDAIREYAEREYAPKGDLEDLDGNISEKPSFKKRLSRNFKSTAGKALRLVKGLSKAGKVLLLVKRFKYL